MRISELLHTGEENGITQKELRQLTGLKSREVRRKIEWERRSGTPILASPKTGYFLPGDESETVRCVKSLRHRAKEILITAAAIENGGKQK